MPHTVLAASSGQRFQQLMAQVPPPDEDWAEATRILQGTDYVQNGQLDEAAQTFLIETQRQMQGQHQVNISLEMAAKQVLINDMTSELSNKGDLALQRRAQQLQTELYTEINELKGPELQESSEQRPTIESLNLDLQVLLKELDTTRDALEKTKINLGGGLVAVADLLTGQEELQQLNILVHVAEQKRAEANELKLVGERLESQQHQVKFFLGSINPEQQHQWRQQLGYSLELEPFLLSFVQETNQPLTVAAVNEAVEKIWPDLPSVKPVRINKVTQLIPGEQYEVLLAPEDKLFDDFNMVTHREKAQRSLAVLMGSMNMPRSESSAFHVRLFNDENITASEFQVYWNGTDGGMGTTYFTPDGEALEVVRDDYFDYPVPRLQMSTGFLAEIGSVPMPLDIILRMNELEETGARPAISRLLITSGTSQFYDLPTNGRITELVGQLDRLSSSSDFWGDHVDRALTPQQERDLTAREALGHKAQNLYKKVLPILARELTGIRELARGREGGLIPITSAEWRSDALQNKVLDIVESYFPKRIGQLQNRIVNAESLREVRQFERLLKNIYEQIIPILKPHDSLPQAHERTDPLVKQAIGKLVAEGFSLRGADLRNTDLSGLDLRTTDVTDVRHDSTTDWSGTLLTTMQLVELGIGEERLFYELGEEAAIFGEQSGVEPSSNTAGGIAPGQPGQDLDSEGPTSHWQYGLNGSEISGLPTNSTLNPFNNPNGIIGNDGSQAGHGDSGNNNGGVITAVAGDAQEPDNSFNVISGQVVAGDSILLPEPGLSSPVAQSGGVTIGGQLGNDKGKTAAELGLDPSGKLPGPEKAKAPDPIPGYGEGVNPQDLNQSNTRDWGGGPVTPDQAKLTPEGFPQKDKTLEDILNPEGPSGARFRFPPGNEEIPAAEYQAVVKALPGLQQISVGEYSQLSAADQNNIISRAVEYQSLPADIKASTTLLQYADSGQTSASQRGQMLGEQQRQTVHTSQHILSSAESGLSESTIQLINTGIEALQQNTAAINQQTQALTQSNANRQSALATPTTSNPVTAAFIEPDIKPDSTAPAAQLNTQADPIPRFMVVRTANGPQLMENLPSGKTQMLPYPIPADTPVTRQASNGSWTHVPDAYAIGAKNLLDTLFLQGAVKMLNNGNAVQTPGAQQSAPQAPTGVSQPAF